MSNISQPTDCITISSDLGISAQEVSVAFPDAITIDTTNITMGATGSSYFYTAGAGISGSTGTVTLSGTGSGYTVGTSVGTTITLNDISASEFNWKTREWEDCFPDFSRVKAMCEQYPGLDIAFEKFKTVYKLVKDDYDNPKD